jgi:hypothetical protein
VALSPLLFTDFDVSITTIMANKTPLKSKKKDSPTKEELKTWAVFFYEQYEKSKANLRKK